LAEGRKDAVLDLVDAAQQAGHLAAALRDAPPQLLGARRLPAGFRAQRLRLRARGGQPLAQRCAPKQAPPK
jgi:hypothetical protein